MIYHLIPQDDWDRVQDQDTYHPDSLDDEGFIHCSDADQLTLVAGFKFEGRDDILVLAIDEDRLESPVRYEGDEEPFPHVYGELPLDAVQQVYELPRTEDGFRVPGALQQD